MKYVIKIPEIQLEYSFYTETTISLFLGIGFKIPIIEVLKMAYNNADHAYTFLKQQLNGYNFLLIKNIINYIAIEVIELECKLK